MKQATATRFLLLTCLVILCSVVAYAGDLYVSTTGNDANDGTTPATAKATIQAAITAAVAGDVIHVAAGTYTGAITIGKSLTLNGPNAGIEGNGVRAGEAKLENAQVTISGTVTVIMDGFHIYQTNNTADAVLLGGPSTVTVQNSIIERFGVSTGTFARGITTSAGAGVKTISDNLFTGDLSGGLFGGHKTWNSGIYINGASSTVNITDNVIQNCRTAINADDYGTGISISGNTIQNCGTFIAFGGTTPTMGQFVLGANSFNALASTFINLSNVNNAFRLDITGSTYEGASFSSMSLNDLFLIEATMFHRGRSGRNGLVYYVPNNQYVILLNPSIQAAIDAANPNGVINVSDGSFNQRLTINKSLTLQGTGEATTILDGTGLIGNGKGIAITSGITHVTIRDLTVRNFAGFNGNTDAGIYAIGGNNNLTVERVTIKDNVGGSGFYANGPVDNVLLDYVTSSGHTIGARGIVIWNGFKSSITITNCTVFNNNCCGIELQDGTSSGVTIENNNVYNNGDNGIGVVGLKSGAGPNVVGNNSLLNNGRFGIEIKLPDGTGLESGDGSIVVKDNVVERTAVPTDLRDHAGIAVFRRGWVVSESNVDIPTGVVVKGNTVKGYQQPSVSEGFGIVVEGTNMTVTNNTLESNDVGIQIQAGHLPYTANTNIDGDQSNLADQYFGRGNSPVASGTINLNNLTGNGFGIRNVGVGSTIDATCNWFGHASGPSGEGSGTGDPVGTDLNFTPWATLASPLGCGGSISGTVSVVGGGGLAGVTVKLLDDTNAPLDEKLTDAAGEYSFGDLMFGDYNVMVVEPLGYSADAASKPATVAGAAVVDFALAQQVIANNARKHSYWKHQFDVHVKGKGKFDETAAQLTSYIALVHQHYTPHFNIFAGRTTFEDWQDALSKDRDLPPHVDKAMQEIAALVMNFASLKVGQYTVVTDDGRTAGEVLTYVSQLFTDPDATKRDYKKARDLAKKVNDDKKIKVGEVPASSILYKQGEQIVGWGFDVPTEFALHNNYPNPFNPTTNIRYDLPVAGYVTLKVFNTLGQEVAVLAEGFKPEGRHMVTFNAQGLPSGAYFYQIRTEQFTKTMKLILMK
jgi:parallel beta-helix repeat protein